MALIDADGYFGGDRFDMVSDSARLAWPSFFLASNTVARIELNYYKVVAKAFYKFKKKPTEAQFWAWVQEYRDAYLLFVYTTEDGQPWGQWDTSEKFLVRHKLAVDLRSPAPTVKDFIEWKHAYVSHKKAKSIVPTNFGKVAQVSESFRGNVRGNGVGGGNGNGEERSKADAPQAPPATSPLAIVPASRGTRFAVVPLPESWSKWGMSKRGWNLSGTQEVYDSFCDFWVSKSGADATKVNWFAAWRNWCRNQRSPPGQGGLGFQREGIADQMMRVAKERIEKGERV